MRWLLDTSACVEVLRGRPGVTRRLATTPPTEVAVSTVTRYELLVGTFRCRDPNRERRKVEALLDLVHELALTRASAERAAEVRARLEAIGQVIGPYDLLLAGQALAAGLVLVTSNLDEFRRVAGLGCESWR
jgi:tRNA(fMet)-specific endonuclease VapC